MQDLHQSPKPLLVKDTNTKESSNKVDKVLTPRKQWIDSTGTENNRKVDAQLLSDFQRLTEEYERLIAPLKDVDRVTQGADYNLAHPLARKDMPTDAYHLGKSMSEVKKP